MAQKQVVNTDDINGISSTCGQNVVVNGNTAEWCSVDSGGRLFVDKPLTQHHELVLKLSESGHADVGILTDNPNSLSDVTQVGSLNELIVIQNAKLHNQAGIIQLKRSDNDDEIVLRSEGQIQYFKVNKSDPIWVTVNIIYGTLKVQIDSDFFKISAVKGENISISSNQRKAQLNIVINPCAVCFFEKPIMRGETLCFSVEPIVRDGKVTHNFSFKVAITEINPAEFLPAKPCLYDITFLPVCPFEKPFKKVQGEIKFEYTTDGLARVLCKTQEFILQNITFEKSYLLIELCKVKLKYLSKRNDDPEIPTRPSANAPHDREIPTRPSPNAPHDPEISTGLSADVPDSPAIPTGVGIPDVTVTTTDEFESVYENSKIQLDLIRQEVDKLSIYDDLLPRRSGAECDQWKQSDLHQAVEGIYKRLESIEERLCNNTKYTSSLECDIKEIKTILGGFSRKIVPISPPISGFSRKNVPISPPISGFSRKNVPISPTISEVDKRSVEKVIRRNYTEFVQLLDTVPFIDRMFQKSHLTLEEYDRIRISSQTNRVDANRDLTMIIFRRQSVDLAIFKQYLIETKQDGVLGKLFPKK